MDNLIAIWACLIFNNVKMMIYSTGIGHKLAVL